jgi:hypothetical protein
VKYYHEAQKEELQNITVGDVLQRYKEPSWCGAGNEALEGIMGCWSLVYCRENINKDYCKDCEYFEANQEVKG